MIFGRFMFGISTGLFTSTATRYIEETVPSHLFEKLGATYNMSLNAGLMIAFFMAEFLPDDQDEIALKSTERWRIFYFWLPGSIYCIILISLIFTIRHDSIKNLITTGNKLEAK